MSNWIPISERLPTREDADDLGYILVRIRGQGGMYEVLHRWTDMPNSAVAWLPLPPYTPPKPEPTDEELDALLNQLASAHGTSYPRRIARDWFADVMARIEREKGK